MFRFAFTAALLLALVCSFTLPVALAEQVKCEGLIQKIEGEKFTVKDASNQEQQMLVVPATKIMVDGKAGKAEDLKIGQHVKCTCDKQGDKMTCQILEATTR